VVGRRFSFLKLVLVLGAICALAYFLRGLWLPALGYGLIHNDGPAKADYAVVLGGDSWGHRIVRGGELVRQGYVPAVLVSGPPGFYGVNEADLAIQFAVAKGYPKEWFIPVRHEGLSTRDEADIFFRELQRRGAHSFLLVTSDHHTARARRVFLSVARQHLGAPGFRTVAADDQFFRPGDWWHSREAEKTVFMEWTKSLANAVGM
jgi:uncharacterized SAM-binding protein YcdF (DUF218 family)